MIKDLKDLQAFFKLCRKQGVTSIKLEGFDVVFGDLPRKVEADADDLQPETELSPEDLAFYSAGQ